MTSHIPVVHTVSGSLVEESILSRCGSVYIPHYLAITVFADFEGANSPWAQRKESNLLLKDNETRDLTVCPLCYVVAGSDSNRISGQ